MIEYLFISRQLRPECLFCYQSCDKCPFRRITTRNLIYHRKKLLSNGIFLLTPSFIRFFGGDETVSRLEEPENIKKYDYGCYELRIYSEKDLEWLFSWYQVFFETIGWDFIDTLSNDLSFYTLCKNSTLNYTKDKNSMGTTCISIDEYSLIRSIYLGLKYDFPDVRDFIDAAFKIFQQGKSLTVPVNKLVDHFS